MFWSDENSLSSETTVSVSEMSFASLISSLTRISLEIVRLISVP